MILVFGIIGLVGCAIFGPIAWGMGNSALRTMDSTPNTVWTNRGNVRAGRTCGIIATVLWGLGERWKPAL